MVPELLQQDATPENLAQALLNLTFDTQAVADLDKIFTDMHALLRQGTAHKTVQAILPYLDQGDRGAVR